MSNYDFIIIGAGAAGCVLAHRLSANGAQVLLLEAGSPDTDANIKAIGGFTRLWGSDLDWQLMTEPQPGLGDRPMLINQGKVIGGSSSINAMMHVRGHRRNYDEWHAQGNEGWSFDDIFPYLKKLENFAGGESDYHTTTGLMHVRDCPDPNSRSEQFLNGAVEAGFDGPHWDYNGDRQENGAGYLQFNIDPAGDRHSAAAAYLTPVLDRPNLTVLTGATLHKVLIEKGQAIGVEYAQAGQIHQAQTTGEVILTAGALITPKLLMLSGIGPAAHLQAQGIPVVVDLPGVGQNLQDHLQLPVIYRTKIAIPNPQILTGNVIFIRTRAELPDAPPDLQLNFTPAAPAPLLPFLPDFGGPVCIFLPILVQPRSRGEITLRSADPTDSPMINPRYLDDVADVEVLQKAVEICRTIASTSAFADLNEFELAPGDGDVEAYIRGNVSTLWHPAGTCKMGRDPLAVVDPQLRVHGVQGLRVADASVMPAVTSGNTHVPTMAIAEKAADLILAAR